MKEYPRYHCMIVHAYYPIGEPRVQRQAEALVEAGYAVDVICLRQRGEPATDSCHGVRIYRLPVRRHKGQGVVVQFIEYLAFFVLAFFETVRLWQQHRHKVIQVHNLPDFLVFAALVPALRGVKVILDLHDLMPEFYASRFKNGNNRWMAWPIKLQEGLACRFADHVITVTEPWRQTLLQRGVPPDKCSVVMNLADDRIFFPRSSTRAITGDDSRFRLIYHGNLVQRYGVDLALRALDSVRREIPEVHLTVHGRGEYLDSLLQLANELGLGDHVEFSTQYMPMTELSELITTAQVGIVPYRRDVFTDGILPTKLMEYAALGMPVIAARTPGIAAYFDETMVQFFTAGDMEGLARCIKSLYQNRARLDELSNNIRMFSRQWNWRTQKEEYISLVEGLAEF